MIQSNKHGCIMTKNQLLLIGEKLPEIEKLESDFKTNKLEVEIHNALNFDMAIDKLKNNAPMVVISTDILMILKLLMKEKEFIKSTSTKTILFNNKGKLPSDVQKKLELCGLTGELTEESTSKTIYYKTTLYLKSLLSLDVNKNSRVLDAGNDKQEIKKSIGFIKEVTKNESGEVEFETSTGLVEAVVLTEFCDESVAILKVMESLIEKIEDEEVPFDEIKQISDQLYGIMGTSGVLGLEGISVFCQLAKSIADHIQSYQQQDLREVVIAVLGDATSFLFTLMDDIRQGDESTLKNIGKEGFVKRLHWLSDKFKLTGDDAAQDGGEEVMSQASIDELLEKLSA